MELLPADCPICKHPERRSLEEQCLRGKLTKRDLAAVVECRVDDVWEHMSHHMVQSTLINLDDKRNVLLDSVNKLRESLDQVCGTKNFGPIMTKQLTELAKELRQTIAGLADLEGATHKEQHITIEQYNDFRSIIMAKFDKLCPICQQIMSEEIEKEENEPKPIALAAQFRVKSVQRPSVLRETHPQD
jgi:hypothetical protein